MKKAPAFTQIELLIVIAIVAALAGISYPLARSWVAKSHEAHCISNLRNLSVALQTYLQEHDSLMPVLQTGRSSKTEEVAVLDTELLPYLDSPTVFHCPADNTQFEKTGSSYSWNHLQNGLHTSKLYFFGVRADLIPLISDKSAWHPSGTQYLFADFAQSNKPRFVTGQ